MFALMLRDRRRGLVRPGEIEQCESLRRTLGLDLSSSVQFPAAHRMGICSLDVDSSGRFVLSGGHDKRIVMYDTTQTVLSKKKAGEGAAARRRTLAHAVASQDNGHTHLVETVHWLPTGYELFTSSGMDGTVKVGAIWLAARWLDICGCSTFFHVVARIQTIHLFPFLFSRMVCFIHSIFILFSSAD